MTIARSASLTKIEDFDFDRDLAAVRQGMAHVVSSARKASETGKAFVLAKQELKWVLESIGLADAGEQMFAGYKSLMVHLWFEGQGDQSTGVNKGAAWLAGCLNASPETIKGLRLIGQVRWQCLMLGLPLDLFSDRAVKSFKALLGEPGELERKHHEIINGYWEDRERIKLENENCSSLYDRKPLPKFISPARVQRYLESGEGGCYTTRCASPTHDDTGKADSNGSNDLSLVDQSDLLDDKVDDLGRVCLLLADAEEAVEILVRRLPKQRDVGALEAAVNRVANQAREIVLTKDQADSLWRARR